MSYELRLHVGTAHTASPEYDAMTGGRTMSEIAVIDLSGVGYRSQIHDLVQRAQSDEALERFRLYTPAFDEDRNQICVYEDHYSKPLPGIALNRVQEALTADLEASKKEYGPEGYRRFAIAVMLIQAIRARFPDEGDLIAIPFGH